MSLYGLIDRKIILPIGEFLFKRNITGELSICMQRDFCSRDELDVIQNHKLQALILHCYENVPYYRKILKERGLTPKDIQSREDLVKLPILTKADIRTHYDELVSKDISCRKFLHGSTGGSTGTPMQYLADINTWNGTRATGFRMWRWAGYEIGEKMFTLAGNSLVKKISKGRMISAKEIYDIVIMRNNKHDCTDITAEAISQHYKAMMKYSPKAIRGYASSLYFLAVYIAQHNLPIPKRIKVVFTTGEKLHPKYRYKIQQVFHVPVFDAYGAQDGGVVAYECYMHEGLHIAEDNCIVEITDSEGTPLPEGETGHVITTDLNNYVFPFLRYKVGDLAYIKKERCSCGRASRLLGEVIGREGRAIYNKEGRPYSSVVIDNMMFPNLDIHSDEAQRRYEQMERFQIRQDKDGNLKILIKPVSLDIPTSEFEYIRMNFKKYFPGSNIELEFVDSIPPLPSGKEDYCVSEFNPDITPSSYPV